jgi:chromate transport protein ChrA
MLKRLQRIAQLGLYMGATVFGGVSVGYPIIRERAPELGEISGEEVDGLYTLAVFLPGPSFLTLWGAVAARAAGMLGALVAMTSLLLPAFLLVLLLPLTTKIGYVASHIEGALQGATWGTAGLLAATGVEQLMKQRSGTHRAILLLGLGALFLGMHPLLLMVLVLAWGAWNGLRASREISRRGEAAD